MNLPKTAPDDERQKPQSAMRVQWTFTLDKHDARLMLKSLRRDLNGDEIDAAQALGDRLTELRAIEVRTYAMSIERAAGSMERARAERSAL